MKDLFVLQDNANVFVDPTNPSSRAVCKAPVDMITPLQDIHNEFEAKLFLQEKRKNNDGNNENFFFDVEENKNLNDNFDNGVQNLSVKNNISSPLPQSRSSIIDQFQQRQQGQQGGQQQQSLPPPFQPPNQGQNQSQNGNFPINDPPLPDFDINPNLTDDLNDDTFDLDSDTFSGRLRSSAVMNQHVKTHPSNQRRSVLYDTSSFFRPIVPPGTPGTPITTTGTTHGTPGTPTNSQLQSSSSSILIPSSSNSLSIENSHQNSSFFSQSGQNNGQNGQNMTKYTPTSSLDLSPPKQTGLLTQSTSNLGHFGSNLGQNGQNSQNLSPSTQPIPLGSLRGTAHNTSSDKRFNPSSTPSTPLSSLNNLGGPNVTQNSSQNFSQNISQNSLNNDSNHNQISNISSQLLPSAPKLSPIPLTTLTNEFSRNISFYKLQQQWLALQPLCIAIHASYIHNIGISIPNDLANLGLYISQSTNSPNTQADETITTPSVHLIHTNTFPIEYNDQIYQFYGPNAIANQQNQQNQQNLGQNNQNNTNFSGCPSLVGLYQSESSMNDLYPSLPQNSGQNSGRGGQNSQQQQSQQQQQQPHHLITPTYQNLGNTGPGDISQHLFVIHNPTIHRHRRLPPPLPLIPLSSSSSSSSLPSSSSSSSLSTTNTAMTLSSTASSSLVVVGQNNNQNGQNFHQNNNQNVQNNKNFNDTLPQNQKIFSSLLPTGTTPLYSHIYGLPIDKHILNSSSYALEPHNKLYNQLLYENRHFLNLPIPRAVTINSYKSLPLPPFPIPSPQPFLSSSFVQYTLHELSTPIGTNIPRPIAPHNTMSIDLPTTNSMSIELLLSSTTPQGTAAGGTTAMTAAAAAAMKKNDENKKLTSSSSLTSVVPSSIPGIPGILPHSIKHPGIPVILSKNEIDNLSKGDKKQYLAYLSTLTSLVLFQSNLRLPWDLGITQFNATAKSMIANSSNKFLQQLSTLTQSSSSTSIPPLTLSGERLSSFYSYTGIMSSQPQPILPDLVIHNCQIPLPLYNMILFLRHTIRQVKFPTVQLSPRGSKQLGQLGQQPLGQPQQHQPHDHSKTHQTPLIEITGNDQMILNLIGNDPLIPFSSNYKYPEQFNTEKKKKDKKDKKKNNQKNNDEFENQKSINTPISPPKTLLSQGTQQQQQSSKFLLYTGDNDDKANDSQQNQQKDIQKGGNNTKSNDPQKDKGQITSASSSSTNPISASTSSSTSTSVPLIHFIPNPTLTPLSSLQTPVSTALASIYNQPLNQQGNQSLQQQQQQQQQPQNNQNNHQNNHNNHNFHTYTSNCPHNCSNPLGSTATIASAASTASAAMIINSPCFDLSIPLDSLANSSDISSNGISDNNNSYRLDQIELTTETSEIFKLTWSKSNFRGFLHPDFDILLQYGAILHSQLDQIDGIYIPQQQHQQKQCGDGSGDSNRQVGCEKINQCQNNGQNISGSGQNAIKNSTNSTNLITPNAVPNSLLPVSSSTSTTSVPPSSLPSLSTSQQQQLPLPHIGCIVSNNALTTLTCPLTLFPPQSVPLLLSELLLILPPHHYPLLYTQLPSSIVSRLNHLTLWQSLRGTTRDDEWCWNIHDLVNPQTDDGVNMGSGGSGSGQNNNQNNRNQNQDFCLIPHSRINQTYNQQRLTLLTSALLGHIKSTEGIQRDYVLDQVNDDSWLLEVIQRDEVIKLEPFQ